MTMINWTDELLTGNAKVDAQHRNLFKMMEQLRISINGNGSRQEIGQNLEILGRYVLSHFADEEQLMRDANYPGLVEHQEHHQILTAKTNEFLNLFHQHKPVDYQEVLTFASEWIRDHVLYEDMKIVAWIKEKPWKDYLDSTK